MNASRERTTLVQPLRAAKMRRGDHQAARWWRWPDRRGWLLPQVGHRLGLVTLVMLVTVAMVLLLRTVPNAVAAAVWLSLLVVLPVVLDWGLAAGLGATVAAAVLVSGFTFVLPGATPHSDAYDGVRLAVSLTGLVVVVLLVDRLHRRHTALERRAGEAAVRGDAAAEQRIFGAIAHDLRTPLTTIIADTQLLAPRLGRSPAPTPASLCEHLAAIEVGAKRIAAMADELMELAKAEGTHAVALRVAPMDLVALVEDVLAAQRRRASGRVLRLETSDRALIGLWDASRLTRVLENLVGNAVKYSPADSTIVVRLKRVHGPAGEQAVIEVCDRGVGIPAAELPHVFERFYRASNADRLSSGAGIGLASAKQIVDEHAGTIRIASQEQQGTTVTVVLPLRKPLPEREAASSTGGK